MRILIPALLLASAAAATPAQTPALSRADSELVARILTAEDRRDPANPALAAGMHHPDARIQLLARRAAARAADPRFGARDSLPALPAPPRYTDPAWRLRYRALATKPVECGRLRAAMADSAWPVRLHAADLVNADCAADTLLVGTLRRWAATAPRSARRSRGGVAWQAAAHALVGLARVVPAEARVRLPQFAESPVSWVRSYAARAAGVLDDTARLRLLAIDDNNNVREAAIDALSKSAGHSADDVYLQAIFSAGPQAVRAAAIALKGSDHLRAGASNLRAALTRWRADANETARDVRVALADRLNEAGVADASPELATTPVPLPLPADAVALALGRDVRLRVSLADSSGGGSFVVRLRGDNAPITAARVLELVRQHWYDNHIWYRVEPDFVIQGGGPGANEYAGHPRFLRDELGAVPHLRGTVGMSTRGHDTGDAQWFINLRDNERLTRDYTLFGEIVEGIDVADGILEGDVIQRIEVMPADQRR